MYFLQNTDQQLTSTIFFLKIKIGFLEVCFYKCMKILTAFKRLKLYCISVEKQLIKTVKLWIKRTADKNPNV